MNFETLVVGTEMFLCDACFLLIS